jgi:small subunit ribosomal protein S16
MLKIRLYRQGRRNAPFYHVVVAEARKTKFIEKLGYYDPRLKTNTRAEKFTLKLDRINYWQSQGAQPTEIIQKILTSMGNEKKTSTPQ